MTKILLTSFQTWLPHQVSNSSDDLLGYMQPQRLEGVFLSFLRRLPVNIPQASQQAIAVIDDLQPQWVICCGMAESRQQLTLESNARAEQTQLYTTVNLDQLVSQLSNTAISHDAGKFVCEGLYYRVLHHLKQSHPHSHGLFVHVPILTKMNLASVVEDFHLMMEKIIDF